MKNAQNWTKKKISVKYENNWSWLTILKISYSSHSVSRQLKLNSNLKKECNEKTKQNKISIVTAN